MKKIILVITTIVLLLSCKKNESVSPTNPDTCNTSTVTDSRGVSYAINRNRVQTSAGDSMPANARGVINTLTDASGQVEIVIWQDQITGEQNNLAVEVDPGFVCIGGGAYADYGSGFGALLTQSSPLSVAGGNSGAASFTTWVASSKDQIEPNTHTLYVYAIGLKLSNISAAVLQNQMLWLSEISSEVSHPSTSLSVPEGYLLMSGGACVNYGTGMGNLLVSSYAPIQFQNLSTWFVSSKDHYYSDPATITAYALCINPVIPDWGTLLVSSKYAESGVVNSGIASQQVSVDPGWVLAGIGAESIYDPSQYGRLLFSMYPSNGGLTVMAQSKDHAVACSGSVLAQLFEIKKQ